MRIQPNESFRWHYNCLSFFVFASAITIQSTHHLVVEAIHPPISSYAIRLQQQRQQHYGEFRTTTDIIRKRRLQEALMTHLKERTLLQQQSSASSATTLFEIPPLPITTTTTMYCYQNEIGLYELNTEMASSTTSCQTIFTSLGGEDDDNNNNNNNNDNFPDSTRKLNLGVILKTMAWFTMGALLTIPFTEFVLDPLALLWGTLFVGWLSSHHYHYHHHQNQNHQHDDDDEEASTYYYNDHEHHEHHHQDCNNNNNNNYPTTSQTMMPQQGNEQDVYYPGYTDRQYFMTQEEEEEDDEMEVEEEDEEDEQAGEQAGEHFVGEYTQIASHHLPFHYAQQPQQQQQQQQSPPRGGGGGGLKRRGSHRRNRPRRSITFCGIQAGMIVLGNWMVRGLVLLLLSNSSTTTTSSQEGKYQQLDNMIPSWLAVFSFPLQVASVLCSMVVQYRIQQYHHHHHHHNNNEDDSTTNQMGKGPDDHDWQSTTNALLPKQSQRQQRQPQHFISHWLRYSMDHAAILVPIAVWVLEFFASDSNSWLWNILQTVFSRHYHHKNAIVLGGYATFFGPFHQQPPPAPAAEAAALCTLGIGM